MNEEKILVRVQKLLEKANAQGVTDEERELLLDKADELMIKHAIDDAMLQSTMTRDERRKPIHEMFQATDAYSPHWEKFRTVLYYIADLHRVRCAIHSNGNATLVGYYEDVEYVKMKWLNIYLHFSRTIDPKWDNSLTLEHNVYNLKVAGRQWQWIQKVARENHVERSFHWFKPAYQRHCKLIGEEPRPHTQRNWAYRESFAESFVNRICARMEEMKESRDKQTSDAGALVAVKDLGVDVDEMFYSLFESLRPLTPEQRASLLAAEERKRREHDEMLRKMTSKERTAYDQQQERERRHQARWEDQYWRNKDKLYDAEGAGAGRTSANNIDLNRNEGVTAQTRKEL